MPTRVLVPPQPYLQDAVRHGFPLSRLRASAGDTLGQFERREPWQLPVPPGRAAKDEPRNDLCNCDKLMQSGMDPTLEAQDCAILPRISFSGHL